MASAASPIYSRQRLVREARLSEADLAEIARCRKDPNRLGFGYHIGFVRLFNRFPAQQPLEIEDELVGYVAMQLGISPDQIEHYAKRRPTVSEHQARIREYLQLRSLGPEETEVLNAFLLEESYRLEQSAALEAKARDFLKSEGILVPAAYALKERIAEQRKLAREHIFGTIAESQTPEMVATLEALLDVAPEETVSELQKLKANPGKASPEAMLSLLRKLKRIEQMGILSIDLSWLNSNYQRALFHYVRKCSVHRLREVSEPRRHAALVCFLHQGYRDAMDQGIDMFDKILTRIYRRAEDDLDEQMKQQRKSIKQSLGTLKSLGGIILDDSVPDEELRQTLFASVPKEELEQQMATLAEWVSGKKSDVFYAVMRRLSYLRRFSPTFLEVLEFAQEAEDVQIPCLEALNVLRGLNKEGKRKLPDDAPTGFVPKRLAGIVEKEGRQAWECALMENLRDEIKAGNIYVKASKRFGRFDDFFISHDEWAERRSGFFQRSSLPENPEKVADFLRGRLDQAYGLFLKSAPDNSFATVDEKGWNLSSETSEHLSESQRGKLSHLKSWLGRHMRSSKLPELLIEVDNELGFTRHFMTAAQKQDVRNPQDIRLLLAGILAHGCNIGPHTMAQLIPDVSYKQLKRVSDWQLTEDTQLQALGSVVNAISRLDATQYWGEGRTSASDGQRFGLRRKVLQQTYSTKFSDFALEFLLVHRRQLRPVLRGSD